MLDPNLSYKLNLAYSKIGEIGYEVALNIRKGKDFTTKQKNLYDQGIKMWLYLKVLFKHVDTSTTPPTLYGITELQVNKLLRCLEKLGQLDSLPIVPPILPESKPQIINKGQDGQDGQNGLDGNDANIVVEADSGETQIVVTPVIVLGVTHYKIKFVQYVKPLLSLNTVGGNVFQKGVVLTNKVVDLITTKGSANILTLVMTDTSYDLLLQAVLNLVTINGVVQPVTTFITIPEIKINTSIPATVSDGTNSIIGSTDIVFYYPFLVGISDTILTTTHYTALSKFIQGKANTSFTLNGTNKYFWIMYPDSYGTLTQIKDQNGFDVTAAFTTGTVTVNSSGLDEDWSITYRYYRTTLKTDIPNVPYSIFF